MKIQVSLSNKITIDLTHEEYIFFELDGERILAASGKLSRPTAGEKIDRSKRGRMVYSCVKIVNGESKKIYSDRGRSRSETLAFLKSYAKNLYPGAKFETLK